MRAAAAGLVLLATALAGCLGGPEGGLVVVAQAPALANGLSIAAALPRGLFGDPGDGLARFTVSHLGLALYPPGGAAVGAPLVMEQGRGAAFVPYADFVSENGDYVVGVDFNGLHAETTVAVEKWVAYVYAFPYLRNDTVVVDIVLEDAAGQPNQRVFAAGQLNFAFHYRGTSENGTTDEVRLTRSMVLDGLDDHLRVEFPLTALNDSKQNKGYYSAEATFHNFQANGNTNVPMDPTERQQRPATNWIYLDLPDHCNALPPQPPPPAPPVPVLVPCPG